MHGHRFLFTLTLVSLSVANAQGIIGTTRDITTTQFCATYQCKVQGTQQVGPFQRREISLIKLGEKDRVFGYTLYVLTQNKVNVAVNYQQGFQDMFYFTPESKMLQALGKTFLGVALPMDAVDRMVNALYAPNPDARLTRLESKNYVVYGVHQLVVNAHVSNVVLTSTQSAKQVAQVEPPRTEMTLQEKRQLLSTIDSKIDAFKNPSLVSACNADVAIRYAGGGDITEESLNKLLSKMGYEGAFGGWYDPKFPANLLRVTVLKDSKDLCLSID